MMNTRCYRCGRSLPLGRDAILAALADAVEADKYHVERCPHCRQAIKIPLSQLRRALPPGWKPEEGPPVEASQGAAVAGEGDFIAGTNKLAGEAEIQTEMVGETLDDLPPTTKKKLKRHRTSKVKGKRL